MKWLFNTIQWLYIKKKEFGKKVGLIYKTRCYFYRYKNNTMHCAANRSICLFCPLEIEKIEKIDIKEHLALSYGQIRADRAFMISVLAIIISLFALIIKVIN